MNIIRSIRRWYAGNYKLNISDASFTIVDALDCPRLALRNKGNIYAADLFNGDVMICCRAHDTYKGMAILLFIRIGDEITLNCSTHKKHLIGYSSNSQIFSAHGISNDDIAELKPYSEMLKRLIANPIAVNVDESLLDAVNVIMAMAFNVDFSVLN